MVYHFEYAFADADKTYKLTTTYFFIRMSGSGKLMCYLS